MRNIQNLLTQVSIINTKNKEILNATGGRFNVFKIVGVNHYENIHSSIIAEFLDTNGTHGLKGKLLDCFLTTISKKLDFEIFNTENARITTEYSTSEGRIDILIEDNEGRAIIIENKIYAEDQPEQLKRYDRYAKRTYKKGYRIIYLTLQGDKASTQSGEGVTYSSISYKYDLINWLEKCVSISSRSPLVRETLVQYVNYIKQLTNTDMDSKNTKEITEVLSNIENLKAAKSIYQNYSSAYDSIIKKHFNPKMEKYALEKSLNYTFEQSEEAYVKFNLTSPNWGDKCWISTSFEGGRFFFGIVNNPNTNRMSDENRKAIHKNIESLTGVKNKENDWWPIYIYSKNLTINDWENDIIKTDRFFKDCTNKIEMLLKSLKGLTI